MRAAMIIQNQSSTYKDKRINSYEIKNMKHMKIFFFCFDK